MKAMVVADIHGDKEALMQLRNSLIGRDVEYFFLLGDYSRGFKDPAENEADILAIVDILLNFQVKAIPGNCDQKKTPEILNKFGANLHNTVLEFDEYAIIGLGGSNPTPFGTPFESSEEEIYEKLKNMITSTKNKRVILMVHAPPKDTKCDQIKNGAHVGSASVRKIIEEYKPELVLCSHIHESGGGEDYLGKTRVLNLGRLSEGRAYMLEVGGGRTSIEFYTGL
ncbi:MAG: metallophosphoesterase [Candidatus Altiarchaeota archaeon]|nr:metallophosphoesterase [Candidatus Altiarchaeota archaeon]